MPMISPQLFSEMESLKTFENILDFDGVENKPEIKFN
jgi:hypothetical protein